MMHKPFVSARRAAAIARAPSTVVRAASVSENGAKQTIEFEDLVDVIKAVDASDVVEMELKGKKFAVTVRKQEALQVAEPIYIQAPAAAAPAPGVLLLEIAARACSAYTARCVACCGSLRGFARAAPAVNAVCSMRQGISRHACGLLPCTVG